MSIAIAGAGGLIGSALAAALHGDGVGVVRLVRRPARAANEVSWDPQRRWLDSPSLAEHDLTAVVNLAGAGIGDKRWNAAYQDLVRSSRVSSTETIAAAVAQHPSRPVLVSGSAIGFYGDTGTDVVDESAPPGTSFLAGVVVDWEAATRVAQDAGIRVAHARTGLVVASGGGAFGRLVPIFKAGIGGRLGSGSQWWSFISLTDEVRALTYLTDHDIAGPVNLVAPQPITNRQATDALGEVLHRPSLLPVPGFALRAAIGGFADEVMLSQGVRPTVLGSAGFQWEHPLIHDALSKELVS
jgi:uncharacterized protein